VNAADDPYQTPTTVTIPVTDAAASADKITLTIPPDTAMTSPFPPTPAPQKKPVDRAKRKAKRKRATMSKRRNRR
jgi:predicted dienelactone hydrolase